MKSKHLLFGGAALVFAASLSITGCRKEGNKDNDTSGAEDNSLADKSFEDMHQISNEAAAGSLSSYKEGNHDGLLSACANITADTATMTIIVDFGTQNCLCSDGRYRRGKIFISYSPGYHGLGYWDSLCSITITTTKASDPMSDSYYVGTDQSSMNQIIGTKNVTNTGRINGNMNWHIVVNGTINKANNGGTITWSSTRDRSWIAGESTPFVWADDIYSISGTAQGTSVKGNNFSVTITSPLIRKIACPKHFVQGKLDFDPGNGKPIRHVDFGTGTCDDIATVTINSNTYTVHMK